MSAKLLKNEGEPRFELLRVLRHPAVGASSGGSGNNPAHVFSMPCPQEVPVNAAIRSRTKKPTLKAE